MKADRYNRQKMIRGWDQEALEKAHVLVAGAGALGNEVIKNLALLGIGHLLIIDFDTIEASNLSRTVLFREEDIGKSKAQAAAETVGRLNPDTKVKFIDGNLFYDIGTGIFHHTDLVISGLDNLAARSQLGIACSLVETPFLDGGMWSMGGEVRWFLPGETACFECTMTDEDRKRAFERRSCTGFRLDDPFSRPAPTTISTAAIIGGLLAQEAVRYLCGEEVKGGTALVYNGLSRKMHASRLPRDPNCPYHEPLEHIVELPVGAGEVTALALLEKASLLHAEAPILELGRNLVTGFSCSNCGHQEEIFEIQSKLEEAQTICPNCSHRRRAKIVSQVERGSPLENMTLKELKVPEGEIVSVKCGNELFYFELRNEI